MSIEFNLQVLETALAQSLESGEFRRILVNIGIPVQADVLLRITNCTGIIIDDFEIPKTNQQYAADLSGTNFYQALKDFFDAAEENFSLLDALPQCNPLPDGTAESAFVLTFKFNDNEEKQFSIACCRRNGVCVSC